MTAIAFDGYSPNLWSGSRGSSNQIDNAVRKVHSDLQKSASVWNRFESVQDELNEVYGESSRKNWDGYGAHAVSAAALEEAKTLVQALPTTVELPEVAAEPDGSLALEWYKSPYRIFSMSVTGSGKIFYAGLFGKGSKAHGSEVFGDAIPETIIRQIQRL